MDLGPERDALINWVQDQFVPKVSHAEQAWLMASGEGIAVIESVGDQQLPDGEGEYLVTNTYLQLEASRNADQ